MFSFLLNLPWEFRQSPFFEGLAQAQHWQAVIMCTRATFGDVCISLIAFWSVSLAARGRRWVIAPTRWQVLTFVAVGLGVTVAVEVLATRVLGRWGYASAMPVFARYPDWLASGDAVAALAPAGTLVRAAAVALMEFSTNGTYVHFHRRAHLPIIIASGILNTEVAVPWWNGYTLRMSA
jgi:hypothetical protein